MNMYLGMVRDMHVMLWCALPTKGMSRVAFKLCMRLCMIYVLCTYALVWCLHQHLLCLCFRLSSPWFTLSRSRLSSIRRPSGWCYGSVWRQGLDVLHFGLPCLCLHKRRPNPGSHHNVLLAATCTPSPRQRTWSSMRTCPCQNLLWIKLVTAWKRKLQRSCQTASNHLVLCLLDAASESLPITSRMGLWRCWRSCTSRTESEGRMLWVCVLTP